MVLLFLLAFEAFLRVKDWGSKNVNFNKDVNNWYYVSDELILKKMEILKDFFF